MRYRTQSLRLDSPVVGRIVNVGQVGFAIESPESLSVGASYLFKVRLGDRHLHLRGRIQWCRLTATRSAGDEALPVYKAGVALARTTASRAWREALRRITEEPAHFVWLRAQQNESSEAGLARPPGEPAASASTDQAGA